MTFFSKLIKHYELKARGEVYDHLRAMPASRLRALGYSPQLLNQGLQAWPWKEAEAATTPLSMDQQAANEGAVLKSAEADKTLLSANLHAA